MIGMILRFERTVASGARTSEPLLVNTAQIATVHPRSKNETVILLANGRDILVSQAFEVVAKRIEAQR